MKIRGNKGIPANPLAPAPTTTAHEVEESQASAPQGDQIEISSTSRQVQQLKGVVGNLPDVRMDKIDGIKDQVDGGTYHVESEKLAKAVIDEALNDALRRETGTSVRRSS